MPGDPFVVSGTADKPRRDLLARIASVPRPTGGQALGDARRECAAVLRAMGYSVRDIPFAFSGFPGRFGTPLVGAIAMALVAVAGHWGARGARYSPLIVLALGGAALAAFAFWLARHGVLRAPVMREHGMNLEATRPAHETRVWLCAHLDSKSQPVPTLLRASGIVAQSIGSAAMLVLSAAAATGAQAPFGVWAAAAMVTLAGAIPVVSSVVGARSPGALDNASGVITVLAAAQQSIDVEGVGVLLTDAEELGLAGAHAWAATSARSATIVLNCDGVDDSGEVTVMYPRERRSSALRDAVLAAARGSAVPHRWRGIPIGLLTDSVAFARYGFASVTFSRGSWMSLARVHSVRDDVSRLTGRGIPETARLMAETARRLASTTNA